MSEPIQTAVQTDELVLTILAAKDPFTLDLPSALSYDDAKALLAELATDDAWLAYDLIHQLDVFGRAF